MDGVEGVGELRATKREHTDNCAARLPTERTLEHHSELRGPVRNMRLARIDGANAFLQRKNKQTSNEYHTVRGVVFNAKCDELNQNIRQP